MLCEFQIQRFYTKQLKQILQFGCNPVFSHKNTFRFFINNQSLTMSQFPSADIIPESYIFKIQDLEIWYNPTVFSSVSALIRTQTLQFPLIIKQSSQGKLKLKNKLINSLQCYYDTRKHKYLPLKIQVDITLEYKGGKTLVKRFMVNLNEFKTGTNKTQRVKILKSVERMFSLEIVFKLEQVTASNHPSDIHHQTLKNQSKLSSYRSSELNAIRHVRVPKTQKQIQQVRSLNTKEVIKSPQRMSDFLSANKKNAYNGNAQIQQSNQRNQQKAVVSPKKEQYKQYLRHLENGLTSQEVEIKNSYVSYIQGDPYVLEEHKLYAALKPSDQVQNNGTRFTKISSQNLIRNSNDHNKINQQNSPPTVKNQYQINQNTQSSTSRKIVSSHNKIESSPSIQSSHRIDSAQSYDQKQMNSLLLEEVKELRKKMSDLLYEKNKLYSQKENNLLQYQTKDKEQKIRHRKELTDQKQYYQELLRRKQLQLEEYKQKWSQIPTQIKEFNYEEHRYQLETLDDSNQRNVSITFEQQQQSVTGRNTIQSNNQPNQRYETNDNNNYMVKSGGYGNNNREKKRIFQSTPITNTKSHSNPQAVIIKQRSDRNNNYQYKNTQQTNSYTPQNNPHKPLNNELEDLSDIDSVRNMIIKLKQQLEDKNNTISQLLKFKQLAHEQQHQLNQLNQLLQQIHHQKHQELLSHSASATHTAKSDQHHSNHAVYNNTNSENQHYLSPQLHQQSPQPINSKPSPLDPSHDQLQEICTKLSNQIQVLQEKIQFLQYTNTALNQQYQNKISELDVKQFVLTNDQQKLKKLQNQLNTQVTKIKQLQAEVNKKDNEFKTSDQLVQNLNKQLFLKEQQSSQTNKLLTSKDTQISRLKNQTQQLKSIIAKLNSKINQLIQINSDIYSNLKSLQNEFKQSGNQQIILHNYHLNPPNDQILNLSQQQERNISQTKDSNSINVVKVPSIVRVNRTQSKPQNPNMNSQYILVNDNQNQNQLNANKNSKQVETITQRLYQNLNNLQRSTGNFNQQDARSNSIIRNNYHQEQLINSTLNQVHGQQANINTLAFNNQITPDNYKISSKSTIKTQNLNSNHITNPNINPNPQKTNQTQTVTINLSPPQSSTTKLIKIEQTPKGKPSPQQYPNEPVKINQQNTPRPDKNPQTIHTNNNNNPSKNTNNSKYVMKTVQNSAQKEPKASSIGARTYRSTRNEQKRTRAGHDSDDCGCC